MRRRKSRYECLAVCALTDSLAEKKKKKEEEKAKKSKEKS
jgi:hypothetical protein